MLGDRFRQIIFFQPVTDILPQHSGDHEGPSHTHRFHIRAPHGDGFEDAIFGREASGDGDVGYPKSLLLQFLAELVGEALDVEGGDTPLVHHRPGAHPRAAGRSVDGDEVDSRLGPVAQGHGQLSLGVGSRFEGYPLETDLPEPRYLGHESLLRDEAEARVALELPEPPVVEGLLHIGNGGVGKNNVAPLFEFEGPLESFHLDFAADALGALAPLELDGIEIVLFANIFGNTEPCILHIQLYEDLPVPFVIPFIGLYPAVHLGGLCYVPVTIQLELWVDTADVFAADQGDARYGGSDCKVLPVYPGDIRRTERAGENRDAHFHHLFPPVLGFHAGVGKYGRVGSRLHFFGKPFRSNGVALNVNVGVIDRIILVGSRGDFAERPGIEHLTAAKGSQPDLAATLAAVEAVGADPRHGDNPPRAVEGARRGAGIRTS